MNEYNIYVIEKLDSFEKTPVPKDYPHILLLLDFKRNAVCISCVRNHQRAAWGEIVPP